MRLAFAVALRCSALWQRIIYKWAKSLLHKFKTRAWAPNVGHKGVGEEECQLGVGELNENWRWRYSSWDSFACGSSCCRQKLKLLDVLVVGVAIVVLSLCPSPFPASYFCLRVLPGELRGAVWPGRGGENFILWMAPANFEVVAASTRLYNGHQMDLWWLKWAEWGSSPNYKGV